MYRRKSFKSKYKKRSFSRRLKKQKSKNKRYNSYRIARGGLRL